jgi:hypothetical protein
MPTPTTYTFSIQNNFPNHAVAPDRLTLEIDESSIVTGLISITTNGDACFILFKDVLSGTDQTTLNAIVAAHSGVPLPSAAQPVSLFSLVAPTGQLPRSTGRAVGYVATSSTGNQVVRATTYTPQGVNGQRSVASSNANDTASGTGAQTIVLNYLTSAFVLKSETIALNGLTPVNTVGTDIAYVESIQVATVGANQVNLGVISLFTGTNGTGTVWASAAIGDQGTAWAHHYVPANVTCFVTSLVAGATVVAGVANLVHQPSLATPGAATSQIGSPIVHPAVGQWDHNFPLWLPVTGPDLIWINEQPLAATSSKTWAAFEYVQF